MGSNPIVVTSWDKSENFWIVPFFLPRNPLSNSNISLSASFTPAVRYPNPSNISFSGNIVLFDDTKNSNTTELDTQLTNKTFAKTVLINSPTSLLGHEFIHTFGWKNDAKGYLARRKDITDRKIRLIFETLRKKGNNLI
ncbi:hypothetical protein H9W95_08740 [Flavobacterium lindanitolerans]|nr:hypothetical protein [Flavobacterium lindanitolerans]